MRMNEPTGWSIHGGPLAFSEMVTKGLAIDLSRSAPKWFEARPVAVETQTFDRFVAWDGHAMRRHGCHLDEAARLEHLFDACGIAAYGAGGCFICKAVDSSALGARIERHVLTITNYGSASAAFWLIHQ